MKEWPPRGRTQQGPKAQSFWRMVLEGASGWEKKLEGPRRAALKELLFLAKGGRSVPSGPGAESCQQVQGTKNPLGRKHCVHAGLRLLTRRIPWPPSSTVPPHPASSVHGKTPFLPSPGHWPIQPVSWRLLPTNQENKITLNRGRQVKGIFWKLWFLDSHQVEGPGGHFPRLRDD